MVSRSLLAVAAMLSFALPAIAADKAQRYPSKPIRLIVPFSPGGTNDILARMVATHLSQTLGETMIVDNRTGAEGIIGTDIAAKARPDGYTLLMASAGYVMNPACASSRTIRSRHSSSSRKSARASSSSA